MEKKALFGQKGVSQDEWNALVCAAAEEVAERLKDREDEHGARTELSRELSERLRDKHGCRVHPRTIFDRSKRPEEARVLHGGRYFTPEFEGRIAGIVKFIRAHKAPVFKDDVIEWAFQENVKLGGKKIARETLSSGWYYKFLARNKLCNADEKPLEMDRAKWVTPENLKAYYKVLAGVLVKAGVAVVNPDFNENVPYSEPILIQHPKRIFSYDETNVSLDQTSASHAMAGRTVTAGAGDRGEVVATKSSMHITAIGGRVGPYALPVGVVFASGDSFPCTWCGNPPIGNVIRGVSTKTKLPNGEETTTELLDWYAAKKKGSMNTNLCGKYTEEVIMPIARHLNPGMANEDGKRSVEVCDGTQVHLGHERLQRCVEAGLEVVIRLPHSTHVTQGEDTVHFGVLKNLYPKSKACVLTKKRVGDDVSESQQAGRLLGDPAAVLKPEDLMTCLREPWEKAFSAENVESAWAMDGIVPFTRKPYWDLRLEWDKRDQSIAAAETHPAAMRMAPRRPAVLVDSLAWAVRGVETPLAPRMTTRAMRVVRPGRRTRMKMTTPRALRDRRVAD